MFAPVPTKKTQSSIKIRFGQQISEEKTPICIDLSFDIFSQKNQNDRFVYHVLLGNQITDNTLLIELQSKKGNGAELADKIMTFLKTNKNYITLKDQGKLQIKAVGKGEACYVFMNNQKFSQEFDEFLQIISQFKDQKTQDPSVSHQIMLSVKSVNDCQQIKKLLQNQGGMRAAFDSLVLNFTFEKTPLVQKVLEKIFKQFQLKKIIAILKGFNHLNFSLNFASAAEMDKYEKLRVFGKLTNKIKTGFFKSIKGQITDEVKLIYFNPVLSFSGKIVANGLDFLIDTLFEASSNKQ